MTYTARRALILLAWLPFWGAATSRAAEDIDVVATAGEANADGRFELFAVAADGNLYHRWQVGQSGVWSDWVLNASGHYSDIRLARSVLGPLYAFGIDGGRLAIRAQASANGGWLTDTLFGGTQLQRLAVARGKGGAFEVLAIGGDGVLYALHALSASPGLESSGWSNWESLGGPAVRRVAAALDDDGEVVVVALAGDGSLSQIRKRGNYWGDWADLAASQIGEVLDLTVARGSDSAVWLLATGAHGWLYGRRLPPLRGPHPPASPRSDVAVSGPPTPAPAPRPRPPFRKGRPAAPGPQWEPWRVIARQPFLGLSRLTSAVTDKGVIEVAAVANESVIATMTQLADGSWPEIWNVLSNWEDVPLTDGITLSAGRGTSARVFVIDRTSARVFTLGRPGEASVTDWTTEPWLALGRIPGAEEPDAVFQALICLDALNGPKQAAEDRASLQATLPTNIRTAMRGTPLARKLKLIGTTMRCVSNKETLALWLDHEAYGPEADAAAILPQGKTFAYELRDKGLRKVFDRLWDGLDKTLTVKGRTVHLTGFHWRYGDDNTLQLTIDGDVNITGSLNAGIAVRLRPRFGINPENGQPTCRSTLEVDGPDDMIAGLMLTFSTYLATPVADWIRFDVIPAAERDLSKYNDLVCQLSQAILGSRLLPEKRKLTVAYDGLEVRDGRGIFGWGLTPPVLGPRVPSVQLNCCLPLGEDGDRARVAFVAYPYTDLQRPLNYEWTPPSGGHVRHVDSPQNGDGYEVFEIDVPRTGVLQRYDLGLMTVKVTDADKQVAVATAAIVYFRAP